MDDDDAIVYNDLIEPGYDSMDISAEDFIGKNPSNNGEYNENTVVNINNLEQLHDLVHDAGDDDLQWLIALGRFDVFTATMSMSRYRIAPKLGHLERLKHIYGYVKKWKIGAIRYRTEEPDYSAIPEKIYDWAHTVYGDVEELIPSDIPEPLGKPVTLTTYVDANLYHDMLTGRSVTAILHFINKTPFDWYSKRQATCETAT